MKQLRVMLTPRSGKTFAVRKLSSQLSKGEGECFGSLAFFGHWSTVPTPLILSFRSSLKRTCTYARPGAWETSTISTA